MLRTTLLYGDDLGDLDAIHKLMSHQGLDGGESTGWNASKTLAENTFSCGKLKEAYDGCCTDSSKPIYWSQPATITQVIAMTGIAADEYTGDTRTIAECSYGATAGVCDDACQCNSGLNISSHATTSGRRLLGAANAAKSANVEFSMTLGGSPADIRKAALRVETGTVQPAAMVTNMQAAAVKMVATGQLAASAELDRVANVATEDLNVQSAVISRPPPPPPYVPPETTPSGMRIYRGPVPVIRKPTSESFCAWPPAALQELTSTTEATSRVKDVLTGGSSGILTTSLTEYFANTYAQEIVQLYTSNVFTTTVLPQDDAYAGGARDPFACHMLVAFLSTPRLDVGGAMYPLIDDKCNPRKTQLGALAHSTSFWNGQTNADAVAAVLKYHCKSTCDFECPPTVPLAYQISVTGRITNDGPPPTPTPPGCKLAGKSYRQIKNAIAMAIGGSWGECPGGLKYLDMTGVTTLQEAFGSISNSQDYFASDINDVSGWDTSSVTDFTDMFRWRTFTSYPDMSGWDTSSVTSMRGAFERSSFNGNISAWDTSKVADFEGMFKTAPNFNSDIRSWNTSSATTMRSMFQQASSFNADVGLWSTASVTDMQQMFKEASVFNAQIGLWDTSSVTNMYEMFYSATSFNQDIRWWDVSKVTNFEYTMGEASAFTYDLHQWNAVSSTSCSSMFYGSSSSRRPNNCDGSAYTYTAGPTPPPSSLHTPAAIPTLAPTPPPTPAPTPAACYVKDWNENDIELKMLQIIKMENNECHGLRALNLTGATTLLKAFRNVGSRGMFVGFNDISGWDVSLVTNFRELFKDVHMSTPPNMSQWDTSSVTDMSRIFWGTQFPNGAGSMGIDNWNVASVTNFESAFRGIASSLDFNAPIGKWNTGSATQMDYMFQNNHAFNQDIGAWDVSSVTTMEYMFQQAEAFNGNIATWDTSAVTNTYSMFNTAKAFNQDIRWWNTSNVVTGNMMFFATEAFNYDLSQWDMKRCNSMFSATPHLSAQQREDHKPDNCDGSPYSYNAGPAPPASELYSPPFPSLIVSVQDLSASAAHDDITNKMNPTITIPVGSKVSFSNTLVSVTLQIKDANGNNVLTSPISNDVVVVTFSVVGTYTYYDITNAVVYSGSIVVTAA